MPAHVVDKHHIKCQSGASSELCSFSSLNQANVDEHRKTECLQRPVPCPGGFCKELLKCCNVKEHLRQIHEAGEWKEQLFRPLFGPEQFSWRSVSWVRNIVSCYDQYFVLCFERSPEDKLFYFWFHLIGSQNEADSYTMDLKVLGKNDEELVRFESLDIFAIDKDREKVWESGKASGLPMFMVKQWMTEDGVQEIKKKEGFTHMLNIKFEIRKKSSK